MAAQLDTARIRDVDVRTRRPWHRYRNGCIIGVHVACETRRKWAMSYQNVTVTLPSHILKEAKHLAVDRGLSLSKFVTLILQEQVEAAHHYETARRRQRRILEKGYDLGSNGNFAWNRDDLHER